MEPAITSLMYGKDIWIDVVGFLIVSFILAYAVKFYRLNKGSTRNKDKYLLLISSFTLLSVSFLAKILSHITIYKTSFETKHLGIISFTYQTITHSNVLIFWGLLTYRILSILALYLFFQIYSEDSSIKNQSLTIFLLLLTVYLGQLEYYIYHLSMSVLLILIIISLREKNPINKSSLVAIKNKTTNYLIRGFEAILLSQIIFIFLFANKFIYFGGEVIQLIGYLLILTGFARVIKSDRTKKR